MGLHYISIGWHWSKECSLDKSDSRWSLRDNKKWKKEKINIWLNVDIYDCINNNNKGLGIKKQDRIKIYGSNRLLSLGQQ